MRLALGFLLLALPASGQSQLDWQKHQDADDERVSLENVRGGLRRYGEVASRAVQ